MDPRAIDRSGIERRGAEAALPSAVSVPGAGLLDSTVDAGMADSGTALTEATSGDAADRVAVTVGAAVQPMTTRGTPVASLVTVVSVPLE